MTTVDGVEGDVLVDLLIIDRGVAELRALTSDLGVSRRRGDSKRKTAERIVTQAPNALSAERTPNGLIDLSVDRRRTADPSASAECQACGGYMLTRERGGAICVDCGYTEGR